MASVLQDDWIMSYVAGVLNEGESLLVETYLTISGEEKSRLSDAGEIAGAFLESEPAAPLSPTLKEDILRRIDHPDTDFTKGVPEASLGHMNSAIDSVLKGKTDDVDWQFLGPGLRKHRVWTTSEGGALWLLKAEPGTKIPDHTHSGTELTLILQGAYRDSTGSYEAADVQEADEHLEHELEIVGDRECICLALTESPIVIKSWSGRLLQKLVGF